MRTRNGLSRRRFIQAGALLAISPAAAQLGARAGAAPAGVRAFPLGAVRLKPSLFSRATDANRAYLHRLDPDRLLHNYRLQAKLAPRGAAYGGWEQESIAGHTLGHYLSACSLMHAQTGDADCRERADYIVAELAACQDAHGDGYVGGFTRRGPAGGAEPGRRVFEEIARGDIRATRFDLNGCWAPFYNWHKLFAGLLDAERHCGNRRALPVAEALAGYVERVLAPLGPAPMQAVLGTEFGGIGESLAELHARTGERRWLALARRFHHHAVLDPLMQGRDELAFLHANTQIPKIIALARLHEIEGGAARLRGAEFFWHAVTQGRSYVIGGNSDREEFQEPGSISRYITEQTCESCNTYNMLKLTRSLYSASPRAGWFDYYERAHLNHVMAQQRPSDGMFAYMVPLMSGAAREFSGPFDSFWCCVGTGMESHAKHGDSIYWQDAGTLYVNLFIASELRWEERRARIALETDFPHGERVTLGIESMDDRGEFALALRAPAWCESPSVVLNGRPLAVAPDPSGYLAIRRRWQAGDTVELLLPARLRLEPTPDDPGVVALLHGPLVLAADLGPAEAAFGGPAPALVGEDPLAAIEAVDRAGARYRTRGSARPADLALAPFHAQHGRRTAVYFRLQSEAGWKSALAAEAAERERLARLDARSIDIVRLGEPADEKRHNLASEISYAVSYRFRQGRDARPGGFFEFDAAVAQSPLAIHATYWGGERERRFHFEVDGMRIASERLDGAHAGEFIERTYPLPAGLLDGKSRVRVRIVPEPGFRAGPVFGCRIVTV